MGDFNNNAYVKDEGYDYLIKNGLIDKLSPLSRTVKKRVD